MTSWNTESDAKNADRDRGKKRGPLTALYIDMTAGFTAKLRPRTPYQDTHMLRCVTVKRFSPWPIRFLRILRSTCRHVLWGVFGQRCIALAILTRSSSILHGKKVAPGDQVNCPGVSG